MSFTATGSLERQVVCDPNAPHPALRQLAFQLEVLGDHQSGLRCHGSSRLVQRLGLAGARARELPRRRIRPPRRAHTGARRPSSNDTTARTRNTKKRILAMPTAAAAMSKKPNTPAMTATTKKAAAPNEALVSSRCCCGLERSTQAREALSAIVEARSDRSGSPPTCPAASATGVPRPALANRSR